MKYRVVLFLVYFIIAFGTTMCWVTHARTEKLKPTSIARIANGTAPAPFVKRRLLADLARGLAALVPESAWDLVRRKVPGDGSPDDMLHFYVRWQQWTPETYPVVFSGYFLIGCSVLGFMFAFRWLVLLLYECPSWLPDLLAGLFGFGLFGGCGWLYSSYPYDLPNCFVFTLALAGLLARRWWFVLAFIAVAYSKETSVLLILAYIVTAENRRSARFLGRTGLMVALYLGVRFLIDQTYPSPPGLFWGGYWYPVRNGFFIVAGLAYHSWSLPFVGFALFHFAKQWREYPVALRGLSVLIVPLLVLGFFMGWFEEKRQYLEAFPILGLMVAQWMLIEMGYDHLLRPRAAGPDIALPVSIHLETRAA